VADIWPQVPVTLAIALVVSGGSLLGRYRHRGQPFGTPAARKRAVAVIVATAAAATALAYLVTSSSPEFIGLSVGVLIPPLLYVPRLRGEAAPEGRLAYSPLWLEITTVGIAHLLDRLQVQMVADRDDWCNRQLGRLQLDRKAPRQSLIRLEAAGDSLWRRLDGDPGRPHSERLQTAYEALRDELRDGETRSGNPELRKRAIRAEKALTDMLQVAYYWGHTDDGIVPNPAARGTPTPAAGMAAGPRSR